MKHKHNDRCLDRPSLRPGRRIPILGGVQWGYHFDHSGESQWGMGRERGFRWRAYLLAGPLTLWVGAW